jgi:3-phenylpropionate/trans-cinnamate dioxygenase ferredoxin reductase subunit
MAVRDVEFVIIGGGVAAAKAAEGLRAAGGEGTAVVLTAEPELPYERPPLSKEFLRGEAGRDKTRTHDEAWYRDHEVELLLATRASTLDQATRTVTTEVGDQLRYGGGLVLATGAQPVRLELPGEDLEGVYYLRSVDDAERLRAAISRAESMVIIGGGFIGAEVAASATQMDTRVTLLVARNLWTRAVGSEMGHFFEDFLRDRGVHVRTRTRVERLEGGDSVEAVVLPDGTRLHADVVVIGVGVRPDVELAERAGLPVDNGILVDQQLRAADGVWAAGDVANAEHPLFGRIRIEHWAEALNQGLLAGRNLAGAGERYDRVPYFYSDQFDLSVSYLGHAREWDELVVRGSREVKEPKFVAWYLHQDTPRAALIVNDWDAEDPVREVIRRARPVDRGHLADEGVDLERL